MATMQPMLPQKMQRSQSSGVISSSLAAKNPPPFFFFLRRSFSSKIASQKRHLAAPMGIISPQRGQGRRGGSADAAGGRGEGSRAEIFCPAAIGYSSPIMSSNHSFFFTA